MLSYTSVHLDAATASDNTVLLLHAFPLSSRMWESQLSALEAEGIPAIAPDVFGVGDSEPRNNWSLTEYVNAVASLLSSLEISKVTLVGLSMGGYQAFAWWRMFPQTVTSLVLCDTRAEQDSPEALANRRDFIDAVRENGPAEAVDRMLPVVFAGSTYASGAQITDVFREIIMQQSGSTIASAMAAIATRNDSTELLASITCPVTFICGTEDKLTPPSLAESMQKKVPGSTLHLIENAGHLSNMEQPERFNAIVLEHLGRKR